jgi:hypothetical protein
MTETGEIEPQDGDPEVRQRLRDRAGGSDVLGARKAMRKQSTRARLAHRKVEPRRQGISIVTPKLYFSQRHW